MTTGNCLSDRRGFLEGSLIYRLTGNRHPGTCHCVFEEALVAKGGQAAVISYRAVVELRNCFSKVLKVS
jgi:hypothetical protein